MIPVVPAFLALAGLASTANAHIAFWHNSMYGFNVTAQTFSYDNRPQVPLYNMPFDQWWMHGHIDYPPNEGDFFELPAGGTVNSELSCDKGATSWYNSSSGGDVGYGSDSPCPGSPTSAFHTTGIDDVKGCGLAIAYQPNVTALQPDDFVMFSINHTCVWYLNTEFSVPQLPACPDGGCHCAWFWIHSDDSGAEQIYMNGFKCKVTGDVGTQPVGVPLVPRRCGADPDNGRPNATPGNCTIGAKTPMYWYNQAGDNMNEGTYSPPYYNDLYGFADGAQDDIFHDGVIASLADWSSTQRAAVATHVASASSAAATPLSSIASVLTNTPTLTPTASPSPTPTSTPESSSSTAEPSSSTSAPEPSSTSSAATETAATCSRKKRSTNGMKRNHARRQPGLHH